VSLAIDCKEDSSAIDAGGTGLGSKAERFPKSNVTGIAFSGFIDLKSQLRIKKSILGIICGRSCVVHRFDDEEPSDNFLCFKKFYNFHSRIPCKY
jgi:hypothetical protein